LPADATTPKPFRLIARIARRSKPGRAELLSGPLRGELLGSDRLADRARTLARQQRLSTRVRRWRSAPLLVRLTETRRILTDVHTRLTTGADRDVDVGPAGEWLLDNFHVVQEHIREVDASLPRAFYRELPELAVGPLAGYPRVYELAITLISHTEARVDLDNLDLFVRAFQEIAPLSIGEIWALPAMLRLALIESVRRMALRTVQRMDEIIKADDWAKRIEIAVGKGTEAHGEALDTFVASPPRLTAVFIARFLHQLRLTRGSYLPLAQIEQWIADHAIGGEDATARSTQHLALTQVVMAHSITSLRTIAHLDWKEFVEGQSRMDAVLREDPAGFYSRMTFATRDWYRHVVERIAKRTGRGEEEVAGVVVQMAGREGNSTDGVEAPLGSHIGYYLIDDGLRELETLLEYRLKPVEAVHRWVKRHPNFVYAGAVLAGTAGTLAAVLWLAGPAARASWIPVLLFALLPAADIAISTVNQLVTSFLPPRGLPNLDLRERQDIPPELRTAVVIPTLFPDVAAVEEALGSLEVQFLANRGEHLHFAILSDFTDAVTETVQGDDAIIAAAMEGIRALNSRYSPASNDSFYLLHRPRRWNPHQGVWMGWERKRGKLAEFNRFLRGGAGQAFCVVEGAVAPLREVRYVITLDADTILPPGAAPDLVGAIAHPLNRAVYDAAKGRVVRGYGILQPRVDISLPSAHRSHFAAIQSGHPGVDPYTTAVSDVYQDLFGEGSFTGKGIYDVDAFERATRGRFPENTLLSHDLIEGSYARAGLVTEVSVYDDYPTQYLTYTLRKHRWIRGDWQLLGWLTRFVPGPEGKERNRLSFLSRWKILDNLRRSTVEIGQLLFLVAGWAFLPGSPLGWTALGLAAIGAPWIVSMLIAALRPPLDKSWRAYYAAVARDASVSAKQVALTVIFLPHQAWISADAIVRTLWRLGVSRRNLLEWRTASTTESTTSRSIRAVWRSMWPAVAIAVGVLLMVGARAVNYGLGSAQLWSLAAATIPVIGLWLASPAVAHVLSRPAIPRRRQLNAAQTEEATRLALIHWRFFDRFVGEETNWLVPDNYQEDPAPVVAMRTSPTNIGLHLLSVASARDLGFIGTSEMTRRLELAFRSLERMQRFRGHFFNWYDLTDLHVLEPAYVSTVDSGNLAGHLIALRQACVTARAEPDLNPRLGAALQAAVKIAIERLRDLSKSALADRPGALNGIEVAVKHLALARANLTAGAGGGVELEKVMAGVTASLKSAQRALEVAPLAHDAIEPSCEYISWSVGRIEDYFESRSEPAEVREARLEAIAQRANDYVMEMDFRFLFDEKREIFSIGFQYSANCLDASYYDLFASEARLASFIAVAKNDVPVDHWFRLGRSLTHAAGETALVSWSGSMFEYLMPALVMRSYPFTILDQAYKGAVRRQIAYGSAQGVPWGVSESAYNLRDRHLTYQYRAFGVPDLALKRGLARDLVVAPYASALAIMVDPQRSLANLGVLERKGALGRYGFRDALDYTRPAPGHRFAVVGTYMAHHIGMSLVSLTNVLTRQVWPRRFHADPLVRSAELLLHERIPRRLVIQAAQDSRGDEAFPDPEVESPAVREFEDPDTERPHIALLGRVPYTLMVSHCGSGYSRYGDVAVTRWRADGTRDSTGQFCYIKDVTEGRLWSAAHQPVCAIADWYRALLATDRATFHRSDGGIETRTEIAVVPEDAAEVRLVTLTNRSEEPREIELTSYGEVVLGPLDADRAHPAFANLFVQTEWHEWCTAITSTRRPRSATEASLWCVHVVDAGKDRVGRVTCETDRARFLGRGRTTRAPIALASNGPLSGTTGAVLDPIFSLRTRVRVEPGRSVSVAFTTLVASTRERAFELASRYHDPHAAQRALDLAWTSQQVELRELDLTPSDAAVFQELAGYLFFPRPDLRADQATLSRNRGSQALLWANGISGDWPIVLATIHEAAGLPTLRQLFTAHHYWRRRGMTVDLVILNTEPSSTYLQEMNNRVLEAMFAAGDTEMDRPGGVFIRRTDQIGPDELLMLQATARLQVPCDGRSLRHLIETDGQLDVELGDWKGPESPRDLERTPPPTSIAGRRIDAHVGTDRSRERVFATPSDGATEDDVVEKSGLAPMDATELLLSNGFGGLTTAGDYRIDVVGDRVPPAPWANVIANPLGGFVVTERGGGFSWAENSYFFRLTPWHNDPVSDPTSEVLYLRDRDSGELWSATPAPMGRNSSYKVRHGAGVSTFECERGGIATRLKLGMAEDEAVKVSLLRVINRTARHRRIEVTAYVEWALGAQREHTQHQVHTTYDAGLGAILARNDFDPQFAGRVAFCALTEPITGHTGDRLEFLGRNGSAEDPAALRQGKLQSTTGSGFDPCAALQCYLDLAPGERREIAVILGAGADRTEARDAIERHKLPGAPASAIARNVDAWARRLSVITVRTPEPSFDFMINRWTLYQALACRMWARSAIYQSSGAYGFRDQLQDVLAFVYAEPAIAREHILRASARQFVEGDVQHWWHPQSGRGVRTRFSDDLAWLPFVVDQYMAVTGDLSVLDEYVPFLSMRALEPHEHEIYDLPGVTDEHGSVYEHCLRALRKACTAGSHGLPLIGIGDWNDGMNRVGVEGRGESVWLAWFLIATLRAFAVHADRRGDGAIATAFRARADAYSIATNAHGWDGEWYRRAYFDDGTPLGSSDSDECRIDSIAQSWSVISGAGDPRRQAQAMRSLEQHLVLPDAGLLLLLTPPFDKTPKDPGYIKGYLPGVRENGAQYTHAALWAVLATALRGDGDRAFELYQMINPLMHARTPEEVDVYKVEPYVVAADIYTAEGQLGRGGWTWYTGSASWMYRVGLESLLGFTKRGDSLRIEPRVPRNWPEFHIEYRHGASTYGITVRSPGTIAVAGAAVTVDSEILSGTTIPLVDDGERHEVLVQGGVVD